MEEVICEIGLKEKTLLNHSYQILSTLSESDLSIVYVAEVIETGEKVVIKEFYPKSIVIRDLDMKTLVCGYSKNKKKLNELKQSFLEEARYLRTLSHPNIIEYINHFEENETAYLVMEYVEGETLDKFIEMKNPFYLSVFLKEVFLPFLNALQFVHDHRVIHRDIKPTNLLIDKEGIVKIIDFGSAITIDDHSSKPIFTTKGYSPLEFYSSQSQQGNYSDIYSVAAILYYILTGNPPVEAPLRVIEDRIEPLNSKNSFISTWFSKRIMKSLSVDYHGRPNSITSLIPFIKLEYRLLKYREKINKTSKKPNSGY